MIRHVFIWNVNETSDGDAVFDDLAALGDAIPGIRNWSIGKQIPTDVVGSVGDWKYILMADFESQADLDAYQNHPAHTEVVDRVREHYKDMAVVDYEL